MLTTLAFLFFLIYQTYFHLRIFALTLLSACTALFLNILVFSQFLNFFCSQPRCLLDTMLFINHWLTLLYTTLPLTTYHFQAPCPFYFSFDTMHHPIQHVLLFVSMYIEFLFKANSLGTTDFIFISPPLAYNNILGIELGLKVILRNDYTNEYTDVKCSSPLRTCLGFHIPCMLLPFPSYASLYFLILSKSHVSCIICSDSTIHGMLFLVGALI